MTSSNPFYPLLEGMSEEKLKELIILANKQIEIKQTEKYEAFNEKVKAVKEKLWELLKDYPEARITLFNCYDNDIITLDDLLDDNAIWSY